MENFDVYCPFCEVDFKTEIYVDSKCPQCKNGFIFTKEIYEYKRYIC